MRIARGGKGYSLRLEIKRDIISALGHVLSDEDKIFQPLNDGVIVQSFETIV